MWILVGWLAFCALVTVAQIRQIGKPREPITPGVATVTVAVAAVLILLVVIA